MALSPMLDIKMIREQPHIIRAELSKRGMKFDIDAFFILEVKRREHIAKLDALRAKQNTASDAVKPSETIRRTPRSTAG